jgi:hypothetical protein
MVSGKDYNAAMWISFLKYNTCRQDPRWRLEGRSRQCELHKSKILLRCWSHTWQKKTTKKNQNSDTLNPKPIQKLLNTTLH